ncbi:MAG: hypothetical protein HY547_04085 [Elusimicrobia bacterium]|nr:hypothetical protein [Elusimicrobiota bacterium]
MNHLLKSKERARRRLARLPIEEKIKILISMQKISNQIRANCGRKPLPPWRPD